jgi:hypothetical protein
MPTSNPSTWPTEIDFGISRAKTLEAAASVGPNTLFGFANAMLVSGVPDVEALKLMGFDWYDAEAIATAILSGNWGAITEAGTAFVAERAQSQLLVAKIETAVLQSTNYWPRDDLFQYLTDLGTEAPSQALIQGMGVSLTDAQRIVQTMQAT